MPPAAHSGIHASGDDAEGAPGHSARGALLGRFAALVMVALAVAWLGLVAPTVVDPARHDVNAIGIGLVSGDTFDTQVMRDTAERGEHLLAAPFCLPRETRYLALIHMSAVEEAVSANDHPAADRALTRADAAATRSIFCTPTSAMGWIELAWSEFLRNDVTPRFTQLLAMSRQVSPRDGWAVFQRINLLFTMLPQLPPDELARLRAEIALVLEMEAYPFLAGLYVFGEEPQRKFLQSVLAQAEGKSQRFVATLIRARGEDIELPEVTPRGARPWER